MDAAPQQILKYKVRLADGSEFGPAEMTLIAQWAREGRIPMDALLVSCDEQASVRSVLAVAELRAILQAPPTVSTGLQKPDDDHAPMSGMIPYKNPPALVGYYVAIGSLFPLVGAVAGPAAIILGVIGLRKRLKDPKIRGLAHAWIAIIGGVLGTLISGGCIAAIIAGSLS